MKKFIILFFILLSSAPVFAKNTSVTVISDVQLSSDKKDNKMTPSIRALLNFIEQAKYDTSDSVVFLGNNINGANRVDTAMFAKIINKLAKPYYVTIGNRDVGKTKSVLPKEYYRILGKYSSNKISSLPCYKKQDDLVFIFLSGVNETFSIYNGYYKENEVEFLDKTLGKFKDKKFVIFQHFPVVEPSEDSMKKTFKPELYLEVLDKHDNVIAVVSGHYGAEGITTRNGVYHISIPAFSKTREYEQIKVFKNNDGTYTVTTRIYNVE